MASRSFVSSEARQECAGREDAGCPEYFTYLLPSAGRVRIFCRPFWRWYGGRRGVLTLDRGNNDTADGGAYNGGCLVNYWGKTYGRSSKIDDDGDDAFGRRLGSRANCPRAAATMLLGDNPALLTLWMGARAMSRRRGSFCGR